MELHERKTVFKELLRDAAGARRGYGDFVEWLDSTDFFTAPASTKYHGASEGMLCQHSLNVKHRMDTRKAEYIALGGRPESADIAALLHDVCKTSRYRAKASGGYEYADGDGLPIGHGERSVILIQRFMTLTTEEIVAIRWHMGAFDDAFRGGANRELSSAFKKYPLALMLHLSDMEALYLDEAENAPAHFARATGEDAGNAASGVLLPAM